MANADILFPSTLRKPETQTFGGVSNLTFFHTIDIYKMVQLIQFSEFSVGSVFPITHPRFHFNIYVWLCLKHLCVDIYAW